MAPENPTPFDPTARKDQEQSSERLRPDQNLYDQEPFIAAVASVMSGNNAINLEKARIGLSALAKKYYQFTEVLVPKPTGDLARLYLDQVSNFGFGYRELNKTNQWKLLGALQPADQWAVYIYEHLLSRWYAVSGAPMSNMSHPPALMYNAWTQKSERDRKQSMLIGIEDEFPSGLPESGKGRVADRFLQMRRGNLTKED